MKAIKIGLAIVVIGAIAFFVIKSLGTANEMDEIATSENPSVKLIENRIKAIETVPNDKFNKEIYNEVNYLIDDHYKPHPPKYPFGRLGETQLDNDQMKKILSKNLYTAYVKKFLEQAFYVFNNKSWNSTDLAFIRSEYRLLQKSPHLSSGSPVDSKFEEIKKIFNKYDEINRFIAASKSFSYPELSLTPELPIDEVRSKLDKVKAYRNSGLGNRYVNNCARLHSELNGIPEILFRKHVQYLDNTISAYSGMYNEFNTQRAYTEGFYTPLRNQINILDNGLYEIPDLPFNQASRLMDKLNLDARKAYDSFSNKTQKPTVKVEI